MTIEAAIVILKYLMECTYVDGFEPQEIKALQMAIEALEKEARRNNND